MRLSCPNCGAIYELPEDRLPEGGGHVQCTDCHTRWFARRPPAAAPGQRPSEDEIIARLEARTSPRPPAPTGAAAETIAFPGPRRPLPDPHPRPDPRPGPDPRPEPEAAAGSTQPKEAAPPPPAARPTPLRPRPDRPVPSAAPERPPAPRRRTPLGFALGLALAAGALGLALGAEALAARFPAAAPALSAYAAGVDALRDGIESALGPLRDRVLGRAA